MSDKLVTIGAFEYVSDLQVLKTRLEAEGIQVVLKDENVLNTDPIISYAIGGVKLQIFNSDVDQAREIYNETRAYAIDKNGNAMKCMNCKAEKMELYYNEKGIFYKLFPSFEKRKYKCLNCNMITKP